MKATTPILSLIVIFFLFSCGQSDSTRNIMPPSDSEHDLRLLAHIDVETTGLIPGYHEMIDIGLVITDVQGTVLDSLFLLIQPDHPERLQPGAYAVNAFDAEIWKQRNALSKKEAVNRLIAFHKKVCDDKQVLMVAYNSHFDAAFLDHLFRDSGHSWREMYYYFVLDIPSMLWGLGYTELGADRFMEYYKIEDEPHIAEYHTGITGAMVNVRIYRVLMDLHK